MYRRHAPFARRKGRERSERGMHGEREDVCSLTPLRGLGDVCSPSPLMGALRNSMSVLSQDQIDDLSPFATPLWMDVPSAEAPAYAGMTLVVQSTLDGRGSG